MYRQINRFKTYLDISITGESVERFLNLCRYNHILLWSIRNGEEAQTVYAKITRQDYLHLRNICRKSHVHVKIIHKHGVRVLMFRYRKHYSFVVGIVLAFVILKVLSTFVWNISFDGNTENTDSSLMRYLSAIQVMTGMKVVDIDCDYIERSLRNQYDNINWVSAEIKGTRLIVHVKEDDAVSQKGMKNTQQEEKPRDIVATHGGIISSIVTRDGIPLVKVGDMVNEGDVLVSGRIYIHNDAGENVASTQTSSDADIMIDTQLDYRNELQIEHEEKEYTNRSFKKANITILNTVFEIGMSFQHYKEADVSVMQKDVKLTENFYLPIKAGVKTFYEYRTENVEYSEEEAKTILNEKFTVYIRQLTENGVQIIDNSVKINSDGIVYRIEGTIHVKMPAYTYADVIAEPVEMLNEKEEESKDN